MLQYVRWAGSGEDRHANMEDVARRLYNIERLTRESERPNAITVHTAQLCVCMREMSNLLACYPQGQHHGPMPTTKERGSRGREATESDSPSSMKEGSVKRVDEWMSG
jgi:hypothetical protein